MDWFSKKRRENKRKQADEAALKASLSEKISRYEASRGQASDGEGPEDDHTELVLDGKKIRVAKKEITLTDV